MAGPFAIGVLAACCAAFHSFAQTLAITLFLVALRIMQDYVVYPKIIGMGIHLHPLVVILAILCGGELGGLAGVFLAIPIVAVSTVIFRHYRKHLAAEARREPD